MATTCGLEPQCFRNRGGAVVVPLPRCRWLSIATCTPFPLFRHGPCLPIPNFRLQWQQPRRGGHGPPACIVRGPLRRGRVLGTLVCLTSWQHIFLQNLGVHQQPRSLLAVPVGDLEPCGVTGRTWVLGLSQLLEVTILDSGLFGQMCERWTVAAEDLVYLHARNIQSHSTVRNGSLKSSAGHLTVTR